MSIDWNELSVYSEPPQELFKRLDIPNRTLMGPGPSNCSERVLKSLGHQVLGHLHPEICKMMDEIKTGIQYAFQTKNRLTLALSAAGHGGMEASLGNLLERGESILIIRSGIWGERAVEIADRLGLKVNVLTTEFGEGFSLEQLEDSLRESQPEAVFVVHAESSTGILQPLQGVGALVHKYGALLIVDTVASLGGEPFFADAWEMDVVYTGSQKCLGAPPGLTPITFSSLAEKKIFNRRTKIPVYYWDMTILGDYWACFENPRIYHHTISATLIYALREALAQLAEETLQNSWKRHAEAAKVLHSGLELRGLEFFINNRENRLKTVTAIKIPARVDPKVVIKYAMDRYNLEISGGLGPTQGKIFRIGLMGVNATKDHVDLVLRVLDESIKHARLISSNL